MRKILYLVSLLTWCLSYYAQNPDIKRTWHWYFGAGAGLDFSSGFPVADTAGKLHSYESCAVMSDTAGNLLFYTDGDTVWDRRHLMMPNGYGLYGNCIPPGPNNSAVQGVIIIPQPQNDSIYYIFTVDCAENMGMKGMNYSILNMKANGNYGDVILKNQFLFSPSTEGIAAVSNCTRDSVWIVGHEFGTNKFYAYLLTDKGFNSNPVVSSIGNPVLNYETPIKFSPSGRKLTTYGLLYEFNFTNGKITKFLNINAYGYGLEFSNNEKYLYVCVSGNIIGRYNITLSDSASIMNSAEIIYNGASNNEYYGLQMASDWNIYVAALDTTKISFISNINNDISFVNFNPYSVDLRNRKCLFTFPAFISNYFTTGCIKKAPDNIDYNIFLSIPNIFTPNADNINDYFSIQIAGYKTIEYFIYNRWGNLIRQGKQELNEGIKTEERLWDGKYKGEEVPAGVYFFLIKATKMNDEEEIRKGFVQLLR